jgi:hypothetical protein
MNVRVSVGVLVEEGEGVKVAAPGGRVTGGNVKIAVGREVNANVAVKVTGSAAGSLPSCSANMKLPNTRNRETNTAAPPNRMGAIPRRRFFVTRPLPVLPGG